MYFDQNDYPVGILDSRSGGFFKRRDTVVAIAAGTLMAVALNGYMWLARIHERAGSAAERLAHALYQPVGYPWCVRFALVYGYALPVGMWVLLCSS